MSTSSDNDPQCEDCCVFRSEAEKSELLQVCIPDPEGKHSWERTNEPVVENRTSDEIAKHECVRGYMGHENDPCALCDGVANRPNEAKPEYEPCGTCGLRSQFQKRTPDRTGTVCSDPVACAGRVNASRAEATVRANPCSDNAKDARIAELEHELRILQEDATNRIRAYERSRVDYANLETLKRLWKPLLVQLSQRGTIRLDNHGHRRRATGCDVCLALYALGDLVGHTFLDIDGNPDLPPDNRSNAAPLTGEMSEDFVRGYNHAIATIRSEQAKRTDNPNAVKACPCLHTTPCNPQCTCVSPDLSAGCRRCCTYGSEEQQKAAAESIAHALDTNNYFDMRCPECGEMMTDHVIVTRHAVGVGNGCNESFTGPSLPPATKPCRTCNTPTSHVTQFCSEECFTEWQTTGPRNTTSKPDPHAVSLIQSWAKHHGLRVSEEAALDLTKSLQVVGYTLKPYGEK